METITMGLKEQWNALKVEKSGIRIRNAANELGVTEVELLATNCGESVTRLKPDFEGILKRIESLGYVMALSRNDEVVHERKGVYLNGSFNPHASLFVGEDIDLRIFLGAWGSAYAVEEISNDKPRRSLQFFAKDGEAVHKIYLTNKSDLEAYQSIVEDFKNDDQSLKQEVSEKRKLPTELPDNEIKVDEFQQAWRELKDTHEFFGMLRKYQVTRTQALRLGPEGDYAIPVENNALRKCFNLAAERQVPIMVFVGNQGMIQIHTGPIKKLVDHGPWFNVLDPEFNLHLKESAIAQSWIVRKPTDDGVVTSLELFNDKNELIATIFGKRKPGIPEMTTWRDIISEVQSELKK